MSLGNVFGGHAVLFALAASGWSHGHRRLTVKCRSFHQLPWCVWRLALLRQESWGQISRSRMETPGLAAGSRSAEVRWSRLSAATVHNFTTEGIAINQTLIMQKWEINE